jgi:putative SOS response-associated peptidase YedK
MCGRYATTRSAADLSALFDAVDETDDGLAADYNVAPTDPVPIVRRSRRFAGPVLSVARWGLVHAWAEHTRGAARMINARVETVATARAYTPSFRRRRCLVPADGWYEWRKLSARDRQPYFMTPRDGGPLVFAGLWSAWTPGAGADSRAGSGEGAAGPVLTCTVLTCTVVTTAAVGEFALVHDRMPLLLPPDGWARWLSADADADPLPLFAPPPAYLDTLEIRPVGPAVGDVRNDGSRLVERIHGASLHASAEEVVDLTLF